MASRLYRAGRDSASGGVYADFFGVYDDMTVIEYLEFFAASYRINGPARERSAKKSLSLLI